MVKQPTFAGFEKPKKRRRVMMQPQDRGCGCAFLLCPKCGAGDDWFHDLNNWQMRYGLPCPKCNPSAGES